MEKKCSKHLTSIGGQAVMEGVMMRGPKKTAIAVRLPDNTITVKEEENSSILSKYKFLKIPVLRGCIAFFESMVVGVRALMYSAEFFDIEEEEETPSKFEAWLTEKLGDKLKTAVIYFSVALSLIFSVLLFMLLPTILVGFVKKFVPNGLLATFFEGVLRIAIFLTYIALVSRMKDIKRVFEYHGAEHKSIHCYESGLPLTVENAQSFKTLHPRCGTNFLLIVMIISIIMFSFISWESPITRLLIRLALLPVVAGVSYEIIKLVGRHDNILTRIISFPGMMLQKLTTSEPDDFQVEVALTALKAVLTENKEDDKW